MKFFALRSVVIFTACAVFLLAPGLLAAQAWTPLGPFGGTVSSLAVHPRVAGVLYAAGLADGVLKSTDGGRQWLLLPGSPAAELVVMDPTRPETLYAVSRFPDRIFKSTDGGVRWTVVSRNLPVTLQITALTVDPSRPVRLYAAAVGGGVWRSGDGGATWRSVSQGLPSGGFTGTTVLAAVPSKPAGTAFAGSYGPGLFRTRNAGVSWERVAGNLPDGRVTALAVAPLNPQILYVSLEGAGLYRSHNGGDTWLPAGDPEASASVSAIRTLAVHPRLPLTVYAGTTGAIFKTTNGGQSWVSTTPNPAPDVLTLAFGAAPPVLYAGLRLGSDPGGVLRSANGGASWTRVTRGFPGVPARAVAVDPADPDTLVASATPGIVRSADRGATWEPRLRVGLPPWILASAPGTFFFAEGVDFLRPVYKSADGGLTWGLTGMAFVQRTSLRADPLDPNTIYAIYTFYIGFEIRNDPEIHRSQDGGATWATLADLPDSCTAHDIAVARTSAAPAVLYLSGSRPGAECRTSVWRSPDGGTTWTEAAGGLPSAVAEFAVDPRDTRVVYARLTGAPNVWKTTDSGASWQPTGLGQRTVAKLAASPSGVLWAYADGLVYRSRDGGASWQSRNGLTGEVSGFAFDPSNPDRVYASTSRGVWTLEDRP